MANPQSGGLLSSACPLRTICRRGEATDEIEMANSNAALVCSSRRLRQQHAAPLTWRFWAKIGCSPSAIYPRTCKSVSTLSLKLQPRILPSLAKHLISGSSGRLQRRDLFLTLTAIKIDKVHTYHTFAMIQERAVCCGRQAALSQQSSRRKTLPRCSI